MSTEELLKVLRKMLHGAVQDLENIEEKDFREVIKKRAEGKKGEVVPVSEKEIKELRQSKISYYKGKKEIILDCIAEIEDKSIVNRNRFINLANEVKGEARQLKRNTDSPNKLQRYKGRIKALEEVVKRIRNIK